MDHDVGLDSSMISLSTMTSYPCLSAYACLFATDAAQMASTLWSHSDTMPTFGFRPTGISPGRSARSAGGRFAIGSSSARSCGAGVDGRQWCGLSMLKRYPRMNTLWMPVTT